MVGGTVSDLTGGKVINGAMTAAFSSAFNDEAGKSKGGTVSCTGSQCDSIMANEDLLFIASDIRPEFDRLTTANTWEYASEIWANADRSQYLVTEPTTLESVLGSAAVRHESMAGFELVATIHSHPVIREYRLTDADVEALKLTGERRKSIGDPFTPNSTVFSRVDVRDNPRNQPMFVVPAGMGTLLCYPGHGGKHRVYGNN